MATVIARACCSSAVHARRSPPRRAWPRRGARASPAPGRRRGWRLRIRSISSEHLVGPPLDGGDADQVHHRGHVVGVEPQHPLERLARLGGRAAAERIGVEQQVAQVEPGLDVVGVGAGDRLVERLGLGPPRRGARRAARRTPAGRAARAAPGARRRGRPPRARRRAGRSPPPRRRAGSRPARTTGPRRPPPGTPPSRRSSGRRGARARRSR